MAHTNVCCPYCGKLLDTYIGVGKGYLPIGPPTVPCKYCSKPIKTNETEWVEKSLFAKARFFTHALFALIGAFLYWGLGFGVVASGVDYLYIQEDYELTVISAIAGATIGVALTVNNVVTSIRSSMKRTSSRI